MSTPSISYKRHRLPTPVAYIIVALALVPFMQQIGIAPMQAHFFVFYFAVFSTLTPPVAIGVLAAAMLADASFLHTARDSMKIALTTFIIPFALVYSPELMSFPNMTWAVIPAFVEVVFIQVAVSSASYGYFLRKLFWIERLSFSVVALLAFCGMVLDPTFTYLAIALFAASVGYLGLTKRKDSLTFA